MEGYKELMTDDNECDHKSQLMDSIGGRPVLIGNVHLPPLPGSPDYEGADIRSIATRALRDAEAYISSGFDAIILENAGDLPYLLPGEMGPETPASMAVITGFVAQHISAPIGVLVVAHAVLESLAVAQAAGADFIRANQWISACVGTEGIVEGTAAQASRYAKSIGAEDVSILADVRVKHASHNLVADISLSDVAIEMSDSRVDALVGTGVRTGSAVSIETLKALRVAGVPVLIGSGLSRSNVADLLPYADGAIVGSSVKVAGKWSNPVDPDEARQFVISARATIGDPIG